MKTTSSAAKDSCVATGLPQPSRVRLLRLSAHAAIGKLALSMVLSLAAAQALAVNVVVGQVTPLSGLSAGDGRSYAAGIQMYFTHVNKTGGVNGNTLSLSRRDDGGLPEQTVAQTQKLLAEERPLLLAGYVGKRGLAQLQQAGLLTSERISLVGYRGGEFVPEASTPIFNVRAELNQEISKIASHLAVIGYSRIGFVHEQTSEAAALVSEMERALQPHGATLVAKSSYAPGTLRLEPAKRAMLGADIQAIVLAANGPAAAAFIEAYRLEGGKAPIFAASEADLEQMAKRLPEEHMSGVSIAQVVPNPYRIVSRLSREFHGVHARYGDPAVPISYAMMEGYIAAKVIAEAVRRAGARLTREGLSAALESIENLDLGGYMVSYRGGQRSGSRFVELSIISSAGRIRQ